MSEPCQVPVKGPDGRAIGQATVTETDEGLMAEMDLSSGRHTADLPLPGMSFALREPDPDLAPHDPLAPKQPRVRERYS